MLKIPNFKFVVVPKTFQKDKSFKKMKKNAFFLRNGRVSLPPQNKSSLSVTIFQIVGIKNNLLNLNGLFLTSDVYKLKYLSHAGVAKLVDVPDLGSGAVRHGGSSPSTRTTSKIG